MKTYWDTSAAINAFLSPQVALRLDAGTHFARAHVFNEFFATMTGRGVTMLDANGLPIKYALAPNDAAKWLRDFSAKLTVIELDGKETLGGLDKAQSMGIQGARVYDYGHALAAIKASANVILTRNESDFAGLTGKARLEFP